MLIFTFVRYIKRLYILIYIRGNNDFTELIVKEKKKKINIFERNILRTSKLFPKKHIH